MIIGHYATALIAHEREPQAPVWLFLLAANLPDFLWLLLALFGIETPQPNSLLETSFLNLRVEMTYNHDIVPLVGLSLLAAAVAYIITRRRTLAFWCLALVLGHEACDILAGFPHHVMGPTSASVGLGLYSRAPEIALLIEAVLGAICVWWFLRARAASGHPITRSTARGLYLVFILGALMWLPIARTSLGSLMGVR